MRGTLVNRGTNRWAIVLDLPRVVDPATGLRKRRQKWITFAGTRQQIPAADPVTGLVECNWIESFRITVPGTADKTDWAFTGTESKPRK